MKAAIYGAGEMGLLYAVQLKAFKDFTIVGVADPEPERVERLSQQCGCLVYTDWTELMDQTNPDMVFVFTRSATWKGMIQDALERNVKLTAGFIDVNTREEIQLMLDAMKKGYLHLLHPQRGMPHLVDLRNKVLDGSIGNPGVVHIKSYRAAGMGKGGNLPDILSGYALNELEFLLWTFGRAVSVYAVRHNECHMDYVTITVKFESGTIANMEAFYGYPGKTYQMLEIAGSKGILRYDSRKTYALQIHTHTSQHRSGAQLFSPSFHGSLAEEVSRCLSDMGSFKNDATFLEETGHLLEVFVAVKESVASQKPVVLGGIHHAQT